jgi:hypothetical protein
MNYKTLGYLFGKALCSDNIDPVHYASQIILGIEPDLTDDQRLAIYTGAKQAISEMPPDILAANTIGGNDPGFEPDPFTEGVSSIVEAYIPRKRYGEGTPEFKRGKTVGYKIMDAWKVFWDVASRSE